MFKVYAVIEKWYDCCEGPTDPKILRIFDSREKAINYIKEEFSRVGTEYEYMPQYDIYKSYMDDGELVMHIEALNVH